MNTLLHEGKTLYYQSSGEGPALLLLHGFCADHRIWEAVLPRLERRYRVLRPDLPGCGRSEALEGAGNIGAMAEAVRALLRHEGISQAVVIGHSMGGYVALELAATHPDCLAGMGLVHSHPYDRLDEAETKTRQRSIDFVRKFGSALYIKQLVPALFPAGYSDRTVLEKISYWACETPAAGIIACQEAMRNRRDHTATLADLTIPVLQLHGGRDPLIPEAVTEAMSILAPAGSVHWLPRTGHMGMWEDPKATGKILRDFADFCQSNTDR